jgi:hypothetical protein
MPTLSLLQREVAEAPLDAKIFVRGLAGTGKTTAGVERLRVLLGQKVPADSILMLTPQRTLQDPYWEFLTAPERIAGGEVTTVTIGGLARRMCDLFWPIAAESAGFGNPGHPPVFLTLETAQYYMAFLVRPLLEKGFYSSLTIDRNRLYSQILDNLNKAAVVGFPHSEIGSRLEAAWFGDPSQRRIYKDAQECASLFRTYCLEHNLLDFSLQLEVFANHLWPRIEVRDYLIQSFRHLVYDNIEEDTPRSHDLILDWLPEFESTLLIYDELAGYRYFLGGDADSGRELGLACREHLTLTESFVTSRSIRSLSENLTRAITQSEPKPIPGDRPFQILTSQFYPQMLDSVVGAVRNLLLEGMQPSEIVILAPYLSDALRFSITYRLDSENVPWRTHRPSRSLRDEPASQTLLTLSALAHPHWTIHPPKFDIAHAFMFTFDTDLVRAQLLTEIVYRSKTLGLSAYASIQPQMQERISYWLGEKYTRFRDWLNEYRKSNPLPLDFFLRRLFGEVLSQPGFGFHKSIDAAKVAGNLIESIKKFRYAMDPSLVQMDSPSFDLGREYLSMLSEGVIAAQYLEGWRADDENSVLVAPAHTYLMMNKPATVQVWLDPGSRGWTERLAQPLTHPYILSRRWEGDRMWLDADEIRAETDSLARLAGGLLSRCRERLILALTNLGETGFEQRGSLLRAFQQVLQA